MNIYLAGPMSGYTDFNFPAFLTAAKGLRKLGYTVFSPAERELQHDEEASRESSWLSGTGDIIAAEEAGFDRRIAITDDLLYIINTADAIALLPGWNKSKGANAEYWTAKFLDLSIFDIDEKGNVLATH